MKAAALILSALFVIGTASPARAQLGGLGKLKKIGDKAADAKQKYDDYNITDQEEKQLGDQVSLKLRDHFGVYQNEPVTKYVSLVGTALAQASSRPALEWKFIVLDTDGVNAYAAPGGIVHITRGLLGLMKSESELAGVLGHEITHVTEKHTVNAIKQSKGISMTADAAGSGGSLRDQFIAKMSALAFNKVFEGEFSQRDENNADETGVRIANKIGYAPNGMVEVLKKIDARNGSREDRNGMFASHPATKDRIESLEKQIKNEKLTATATVESRYKQTITFDAKPVSEIAMDVAGAAGLASGDKKKEDDKKADDKKADEPKKNKFGLSSITGGKQTQASQQTASAGARGGLPDRDAKGGPNKSPLGVKITAAELEAFKKGIAS
jgi:beta-barrel assembly-enhancing protease